jgi:zinc transport system substrate-binding protein
MWPSLVLVATLGLGATACTSSASPADSAPADDTRLTVAVAFFPLEEIARRVGGDRVRVVTLVPPGQEAHEYEPTAKQLDGLEKAQVVLFLGHDFQPTVEKAVAALPDSIMRVDLLDTLTLMPAGTGIDPHVWLDPLNMAAMTRAVIDAFTAARPDDAGGFAYRGDVFLSRLSDLDRAYAHGLRSCQERTIVSSHRSYDYLAARYGLQQASIAGMSPGEEPSAKDLEGIVRYAKANHVRTIFFDSNLPSDLATTVAHEAGVATAVLNPAESLSSDDIAHHETYITVMETNLVQLREGLQCQ